jgi:cell division transport system permease protein
MGGRWRYLFAEVGRGLRRNILMTLATVVTVTVSLALLGAALLMQAQVDKAQRLLYGEVEVSIFLQDDITQQQQAQLESDLAASPVVQDVSFESKEQAYENFQELFEDDQALLESVSPEVLPASFRVELTNPERFQVVAQNFSDRSGVEEVRDQREVLDRFFRVMSALRNAALAVAGLQLLAAAALISNTIRVTAFARREQTGIMKLVGATNWYIRMPFMLEGIVAGVVGALAATGLLAIAMTTLVDRLRQEVTFIPFITLEELVTVAPVLVVLGAGLAAVASFVALRRFLAV